MLSDETILQIFRDTKALLEGHFELSSGLHSQRYIQCARVLQYPEYASILCQQLSKKFRHLGVTTVIGPALGAVVVAQEMGRALSVRSIFSERKDGKMTLRRGFELAMGEKILAVEDVITTGGSLKEVLELVKEVGGDVVSVGALVDRSQGKVDFGVPMETLIQLDVETYDPKDCPLCKSGVPIDKPGSRPGA